MICQQQTVAEDAPATRTILPAAGLLSFYFFAAEAYGLNLTEADFALLSGFGGGMGGDCSCIIWILIILCCCGGNNGFGGFGCGC